MTWHTCTTSFTCQARPSPAAWKHSPLQTLTPESQRQHRSVGHWRVNSQWLDNSSQLEVAVPVEVCFKMWEDRTSIPKWMPWISSVVVQESDPALSKWTLSTRQFGREWTFSWLARNLTPIRNQKIHWINEPNSSSMPGIEVNTRGSIRFIKRGPDACSVTLTISYEVPGVLAPFASALTPVVTGVLDRDMKRFQQLAMQIAAASPR